jgi:hypothetical protein
MANYVDCFRPMAVACDFYNRQTEFVPKYSVHAAVIRFSSVPLHVCQSILHENVEPDMSCVRSGVVVML